MYQTVPCSLSIFNGRDSAAGPKKESKQQTDMALPDSLQPLAVLIKGRVAETAGCLSLFFASEDHQPSMDCAATLQCALQAHQTQHLLGRRIIRQFCALRRCVQWHIPGPFDAQPEAPFLINRRSLYVRTSCQRLAWSLTRPPREPCLSIRGLTCTMAECGK